MKYTIGEIYRLGLIKTRDGESYKHRESVAKYLKRKGVRFETLDTPAGKAKLFDIKDLREVVKRKKTK